jgi:hypothetical protein
MMSGAVPAVVRFVGIMAGLVVGGGTGGVLLAVLGGPNVGILGALLGLVVAFALVRVLMQIPSLQPILRWLYLYEGWTGDEEGNLPPL